MVNSRSVGRPRTLDRRTGIEIAERLFWSRGYEGTSIADLTTAMGVKPPSLYAAYGSKENLYREAMDYFAAENWKRLRLFEDAPTGFEAVKRYLTDLAFNYCDPSNPKGCMISASMVHYAAENAGAAAVAAAYRQIFRKILEVRFERSVKEGEIPRDTDILALSRLFAGIVSGLSVQASDGATSEELMGVVSFALEAWPGHHNSPKPAF